MTEPTSFRELISCWGGLSAFADDLGVPYVTAQKMRDRDSVAVRHWPTLIEKAKGRGIELSPDKLLAMASTERAA